MLHTDKQDSSASVDPKLARQAGIISHAGYLSEDLGVAAEAAMLAGNIIRDGYDELSSIKLKSVGDFVTDVDAAADERITGYLKRLLPEDKIISEELSPDGKLTDARTWIVDPLDGTSAFIFRTDPSHPAVMLALSDHCEIVCSMIHFPLTDEWYYAARGKGAYFNGEKLDCAYYVPPLGESQVVLNRYADASFETEKFHKVSNYLRSSKGAGLVTVDVPHSGVSCRVASRRGKLVAAVHDNNPHKRKQELWDVAPVKLLLEESGGVFWNSRGLPYDVTETDLIVAAANRETAERLLAGLNS